MVPDPCNSKPAIAVLRRLAVSPDEPTPIVELLDMPDLAPALRVLHAARHVELVCPKGEMLRGRWIPRWGWDEQWSFGSVPPIDRIVAGASSTEDRMTFVRITESGKSRLAAAQLSGLDVQADRQGPGRGCRFVKSGKHWLIEFGDTQGSFPDTQPFQVLREILARPHPQSPQPAASLLGEPVAEFSSEPATDEQYLDEVEAKARKLSDEIRAAREAGASEEVQRLTVELRGLVATVKAAEGFGTREVQITSGKTRSQTSRVDRAVRTAYEQLDTADPPLSALVSHLKLSVKRESNCWAYRPAPPIPQWEI